MLHPALIALVTLAYLGLLFAVARWTHSRPSWLKLAGSAPVYSLSLAVYCTSWTFYGCVGTAATSGLIFLTTYIGPTICALLWWRVLGRMIRLKDAHHLTSIADLISARYGKSARIAALATLLAFVGMAPYVALQLKSVSTTFSVLAIPDAGPESVFAGFIMPATAILMILFTIAFGIRRLDPTERHPGVVMAVAVESVVKLAALLALGLIVVAGAQGGLTGLLDLNTVYPYHKLISFGENGSSFQSWAAQLILSMSAILFLPRQFHAAVVENPVPGHVNTAAWLFPLYVFLISLFIVPIALAGLAAGLPAAQADTFVLRLPMIQGRPFLALFVFLGGFSAATAMIVVEAMTMSTMLTNHVILPVIDFFAGPGSFKRRILQWRWTAAAAFICSGWLLAEMIGDTVMLADLGLIAFAAALQFAPPILGGLYWRGAGMAGAALGMIAGFAVWTSTLLIPALVKGGLTVRFPWLGFIDYLAVAPGGALEPVAAAVFWSLLANSGVFVLGSLLLPGSDAEREMAEAFVEVLERDPKASRRGGLAGIALDDKVERLKILLWRYFTPAQTSKLLTKCLDSSGLAGREAISVVELADLYNAVETSLAGAIGASAAHSALSRAEIFTAKETLELSEAYGEILADLKLTPDELRARGDFYQERERMLALHAGELEEKILERDHEIEVRKQAEQESRLAESRLRALFDNSPVGIYQSTPGGRYIRVNPQFARIFGYDSPEEVVAEITDIATDIWVDPGKRKQMGEILTDKGEVINFEAENRRKDGTVIWTSRNLRAMYDADGSIKLYDGFVTDISDRKKAEDDLLQLNLELESRVATRTTQLERTNADLVSTLAELRKTQDHLIQSEKMAALGGLVAGVAHEVNTPLGVSLTAASHLESKARSTSERYQDGAMTKSDFEGFVLAAVEGSAMILANLRRAADLVRSFKMVAVDQSSEEKRRFRLKYYIDEVLLSLRPKLKKTLHRVVVDCDPELTIVSYPGAFSQIITNLVVNSLMHAFDDNQTGTIRISARVDGQTLVFTYADDGRGIEKRHLSKIFEPFYTTGRFKGGTGLGLNILYNIVTQTLKGTVACQSEPGQGARFIISVPLD